MACCMVAGVAQGVFALTPPLPRTGNVVTEHDYPVPAGVLINATVSVLHQLGYVDAKADSGGTSASASQTEGSATYTMPDGAKVVISPLKGAYALVQQSGCPSHLRISFQKLRIAAYSNTVIIGDNGDKLYASFFDLLGKELNIGPKGFGAGSCDSAREPLERFPPVLRPIHEMPVKPISF